MHNVLLSFLTAPFFLCIIAWHANACRQAMYNVYVEVLNKYWRMPYSTDLTLCSTNISQSGPIINFKDTLKSQRFIITINVPLFKGSVSQDFRPPVFSLIRTHLGP